MITKENFIDIFDDCHVELINYAYYRVGDIDQAKDLAQEAFVQLWKKKAELEDIDLMISIKLCSLALIEKNLSFMTGFFIL